MMQKLLYFGLIVYFVFYTLESPLRYALQAMGKDEWIFVRDGLLAVPLALIFIRQALDNELHPAFWAYLAIVALHGLVMLLNTHSVLAVTYSAKMLMGMLAGAVGAPLLFAPGRRKLAFFLLLWCITSIGVGVDKFYVDFPWTGMQTTIGDMHVDISRNWQVLGDAKRAGGFMRSSINVAIALPLFAFVLLFQGRSFLLKTAVALGTVAALWWTTQKGALIAYCATLALLAPAPRWQFSALRLGFFCFMLLMIALPLALPGFHMPSGDALASFRMRVEEVWPEGWDWIARHQAFPFGIGLGGLGGAQRMWSPDRYTAGDNMFIFLYGNLGLMALFYLGWLSFAVIRLDGTDDSPGKSQAMATLMFLMGYGCVLSLIEDQMALVFSGAAAAWLAAMKSYEIKGGKKRIESFMRNRVPTTAIID